MTQLVCFRNLTDMSNRFLFYSAVITVFGITAPIYLNKSFLLLLTLLVCFILKKFPIKQSILLFVIFSLFCIHSFFWDRTNTSQLSGEETQLLIYFSSYPEINGDRVSGLAKLSDNENIWITYRINNEEEAIELKNTILTGMTFRVKGNLKKPTHATVENGFDFLNYLRFNRAHWILEIKNKEDVSKETRNLLVKLAQMREREIKRIDRLYSETAGSFTKALIFGEQNGISEDMYNQFKKLGIVHILALSGMQVALVAAILFYGFLRIGFTRSQTFLLLACLLPFYAVITGLSASIVRACMMASIFMFGQFIGLRLTALKTITICLMGYLLINPYQIFQIGFQLSFLLTYGLILSTKILRKSFHSTGFSLFIMTIICQIISLPIIIYHFYETSLIGFISNLLYVPLFSYVFFPVTIAVYLLVILDVLVDPGMWMLNFIYSLLEKSTEFMSALPVSVLIFGKPSNLVLAVIVIGFISILIGIEKGSKYLFQACLITALLLFYQYNSQFFSKNGEITFIDVGQGDSTFIQLPGNGGTYLIDTGGAALFGKEEWSAQKSQFDPGADIIVPFLKSKGIKIIDKLILTHADQDHVGGAKAIIEEMKIGEILIPFEQREEFKETESIKEAIKYKIPVKEVQAGMSWNAADANFKILSPLNKVEEKNESSIVIKARINQLDWLLVGDLGELGEDKLLEQNKLNLRADILKVGHHGSRNSSQAEFIRAVNPKIAVISAGRGNRFGHPHGEVINLLDKEDIMIYRTDLQGSIKYKYSTKKDGTISVQSP